MTLDSAASRIGLSARRHAPRTLFRTHASDPDCGFAYPCCGRHPLLRTRRTSTVPLRRRATLRLTPACLPNRRRAASTNSADLTASGRDELLPIRTSWESAPTTSAGACSSRRSRDTPDRSGAAAFSWKQPRFQCGRRRRWLPLSDKGSHDARAGSACTRRHERGLATVDDVCLATRLYERRPAVKSLAGSMSDA